MIRRYKGQGLVFIGVHSDPGKPEMLATMKQLGMDWPVYLDGTKKMMRAYHGAAYPSYFLIDRKGILRVADIDDPDLDKAVAKLIKEKAK